MFGHKCRWEFTCCVLRHWRSPILLQYNHKANHINPVRSRSSDVEYSYFVKMWLRATEMTCFVLWLSLPVDLLNWIDHPSHMSARRRQSKSGIHYLQNNKKKLVLSKRFNMASFEHQIIMPQNLETASAVKLCHVTLLSSLLINLRQILQCLF